MVWLQQPSKQANLQREIQHAPDLPMHHSVDRIFAQWYCLRVSKSNPAPLTRPGPAGGCVVDGVAPGTAPVLFKVAAGR